GGSSGRSRTCDSPSRSWMRSVRATCAASPRSGRCSTRAGTRSTWSRRFTSAAGTSPAGPRASRDNRRMSDLDYGHFDALTFDCYGTLIDWETGILAGLRAALAPHGVDGPDDDLLEAYAAVEAKLESGPYLPYRTILAMGARKVASGLGTELTDDEATAFGGSVGDWPAFDDTTRA